MERWVGKVAVVTGASSGIGAATAVALVKAGMVVVGLARRSERILELRAKVPTSANCVLHALACDVRNEDEVKAAFKWIIINLGGVDVLINNAGIFRLTRLIDKNNTADIKAVLDTNVMAPVLCTREAFQSMKSRGVDGHVIMMNAIYGHYVPQLVEGISFNIDPPSKHAITAMTEVLRQEFQAEGTKIKVTSISPGNVRTEIVPAEIRYIADNMPILEPEDIAAAVLYVLGTPPHVQVHELTIRPVGEPI